MKIGNKVWVRVGLDRVLAQGELRSVDLAAGTGTVRLLGRLVTRDLKHIDAKMPRRGRRKQA